MFRSFPPRFAVLVLLVVGIAIGYLAACTKTNPEKSADAAPVSGDKAQADNAAGDSSAASPSSSQPGDTSAAVGSKPNIVFIMGDDIGMWNIGAYHRGMMAGRTPNIDRIASEGILFTDYYAEASCTAGRANFITGELPIRTGLTTVGQAGAPLGMPAAAPTIATVLRDMGYATGQFGKNHLGDLNKYLPTVHGFDEFFGYLYHLDAMQDPFNRTYPPDMLDKVGPRNVLHCWATDEDDTTVDPRWGQVGRQKIEDMGPLPPHPTEGIELNMETIDTVILDHTIDFIERSHEEGKPFFVWMNPSRMHIFTYLDDEYEDKINPENGWSIQEAGMAQFDDVIGSVMDKLEELGIADNTIIVVTTDNGAETFTWPDGGTTPFRGEKGMVTEGGFRVPCVMRWPAQIDGGQVRNGVISGLDWFPTFVAAAGNTEIVEQLMAGAELNGAEYKVHLDGYNQLDMLINDGESARDEIWYFAQTELGAVRINDFKYVLMDQPGGWLGANVHRTVPMLYNLRLDPFERMELPDGSWMNFENFYGREFWRFVFLQEEVEATAKTFIEYPPMQGGASFNLDAVKAKVQAAMAAHGQ